MLDLRQHEGFFFQPVLNMLWQVDPGEFENTMLTAG